MAEGDNNPMAEIEAIQAVAKALADLNDAEVKRVLRWAADKFGAPEAVEEPDSPGETADGAVETGSAEAVDFDDVADLYSAAAPTSDPERALVVGYWLQYHEEMQEFDSQKLNSHLKHLGHGVSNITSALDKLKGRKPQLVIQTKKSGTSKQARKKYKVTTAGKQAVEEMLKKGE